MTVVERREVLAGGSTPAEPRGVPSSAMPELRAAQRRWYALQLWLARSLW